jgi:hypothetical protein
MKNRYLVMSIILIALNTGSNAFARVLPVNEDLESQENFIMQNIDMPDLPGISVYFVLEDELLPFERPSIGIIKEKYEVYTYFNVFLALIPELTISNTNVEQKVGSVKDS